MTSEAAQTDTLRLFTASVDSEDMSEGEWNDLLYIAAEDEHWALNMAVNYVREHRDTREITNVEVFPYKGEPKVLASFAPDEED